MQKEFNELNELLIKESDLKDEITAKKDELCEKYHPLSIGSVVECNAGYSHEGKNLRVEKVWFGSCKWTSGPPTFCASGTVLKKNGEDSVYDGLWKQPNES